MLTRGRIEPSLRFARHATNWKKQKARNAASPAARGKLTTDSNHSWRRKKRRVEKGNRIGDPGRVSFCTISAKMDEKRQLRRNGLMFSCTKGPIIIIHGPARHAHSLPPRSPQTAATCCCRSTTYVVVCTVDYLFLLWAIHNQTSSVRIEKRGKQDLGLFSGGWLLLLEVEPSGSCPRLGARLLPAKSWLVLAAS